MTIREQALAYAWSWLGRPYVWGGDDPAGIDCSGFAIEVLTAVGILPHGYDNTAAGLFTRLSGKLVATPRPGALVFYANQSGEIVHVGIVLENNLVIQASGGGSGTVSSDAAWAASAFVKIRPLASRIGSRVYVDPFME